jgi:hypothetical protein
MRVACSCLSSLYLSWSSHRASNQCDVPSALGHIPFLHEPEGIWVTSRYNSTAIGPGTCTSTRITEGGSYECVYRSRTISKYIASCRTNSMAQLLSMAYREGFWQASVGPQIRTWTSTQCQLGPLDNNATFNTSQEILEIWVLHYRTGAHWTWVVYPSNWFIVNRRKTRRRQIDSLAPAIIDKCWQIYSSEVFNLQTITYSSRRWTKMQSWFSWASHFGEPSIIPGPTTM